MWISVPRCHDEPVGSEIGVRRIDFGYFVRPGSETAHGAPRVEPVLGYLVTHQRGQLLFDTGMGADPDVDEHYRPRRVALIDGLRSAGKSIDDVTVVANCHLHFDHCGGNPQLRGRPIAVQAAELETARRTVDYTLPDLVDAPGLRYEVLDGEAEVMSGVFVIPTPGHTSGHQSVVVRQENGSVVVAGQSHDTASSYSADVLAWRAGRDQHAARLPLTPPWVDRLQQFDPRRVVFAHDHSVWVP